MHAQAVALKQQSPHAVVKLGRNPYKLIGNYKNKSRFLTVYLLRDPSRSLLLTHIPVLWTSSSVSASMLRLVLEPDLSD